jgi:hypothetical protein
VVLELDLVEAFPLIESLKEVSVIFRTSGFCVSCWPFRWLLSGLVAPAGVVFARVGGSWYFGESGGSE